ncbi:MAG: hypothetical protein KDD84_05500, partial [Caldilineaceae bacterium]|nr:hypothetical protein [Caldilineaceae bacterium]
MDLSERRRVLAEMHYIRRQIDDTLERVLDTLDARWAQIPTAAQETIRRRRADLADQLDQAVTSFERGIKITSFLNDLETIDAVLEFAYDELLGGKTSEVFRNAGGPDQETTNRIVSALRRDPQQTPRSTSGFESGGGLESMISEAIGVPKE